jgi:drug/metabolite transporter (DMT)-like permease
MLLATVFWSFGGVFGRKSGASGLVLTFWRMWIGTALFLVIALVLKRRPSLDDLRRSALAGVVFGLNVAAFFTAIETISVATTLIISALAPVAALPISVAVFHDRLTTIKVVCAVVAVVGVVVAVLAAPDDSSPGGRSGVGYVWAIVSLVLWLAYLLLSKGAREHVETVRFLLVVTFTGALAVTVAVLISGRDLRQVHGGGWWWVLCLAVVPGVFGHGLVAWAQPRVDASATAVLIQAEPVFASINAWVFLHERLRPLQSLAGLGVIVALAALAWREAREGSIEVSDIPI